MKINVKRGGGQAGGIDLEGQGPKEILPFAFTQHSSRLLMLTKASLDLLNEKLKGLLRIPKTQTAKDDDAIH